MKIWPIRPNLIIPNSLEWKVTKDNHVKKAQTAPSNLFNSPLRTMFQKCVFTCKLTSLFTTPCLSQFTPFHFRNSKTKRNCAHRSVVPLLRLCTKAVVVHEVSEYIEIVSSILDQESAILIQYVANYTNNSSVTFFNISQTNWDKSYSGLHRIVGIWRSVTSQCARVYGNTPPAAAGQCAQQHVAH